MEINKKLIILSKTNDEVILKIGKTDEIIKLSVIELDIIKYYSEVDNNTKVISHFKNIVEIIEDDLNTLINKAKSLKILVSNNKKYLKEYWIKPKLKRNKKIFEVFTIDFSGSYLERILEKKLILKIIISISVMLLMFMLYNIASSPLNFKQNYLETLYAVPIKFKSLIGFIYLSTFISVCFHEIGHYFFYKLFKGKTSIFGFGLLFFFLPVFYNKILVSLIKEKKEKIIINFGGMIFDLFLLIFLIFFTKNYHILYPTISFLCYVTIISICIRTFFNINIFLPSTDGYFVFSDTINKPNLFDYSNKLFKEFIKSRKTKAKNLPYIFYAVIGYLSIFISWCFFFLPLIIYFYYAFKN
jgi:hypothetical protein